MPASDALSFLMAWTLAPFRMGSVTPSSPSLAALITREIAADTGPVLELGPGTGPFTRALLQRGVRENDLTLVESDPDFAALLARRFPSARIVEMDAVGLCHLPLFDGPERFEAWKKLIPMASAPVSIQRSASLRLVRPQIFTKGAGE